MNYQMHVQGAFIVIYNNNAASPVRSTSYFYGYFQFTKNKVVAFLFTYKDLLNNIFKVFFRNTELSRVYYYCFENGFASTK